MTVGGLPELRACFHCSLIKEYVQFESDGCENCPFLGMKDNPARVLECTSSNFEGTIEELPPEVAWVPRYQPIEVKVRGLYAVAIYPESHHPNS